MYFAEIDGTVCLTESRTDALARLQPPIIVEDHAQTELPLLFQKDYSICYGNENDLVTLSVEPRGEGLFYIKRRWKNLTDRIRFIKTIFGVVPCFDVEKYLIPCVSVNGNAFGNGLEPKGVDRDGEPWIFSYDRVSIPSCTLTENRDYSVSLFVSDESSLALQSSCSVRKHDATGSFIQEIYHPITEAPLTYCTRDGYCDKYEEYWKMEGGATFDVGFYLLISKPKWENYGIVKTLDVALSIFSTVESSKKNPKKIWDDSIAFAKSLVSDYKGKKGFIIGYLPDAKGGFSYREDDYFELAWCGQNILFSRMLIKDYLINGDKTSLSCALEILDTRVKHCISSKGLLASQLKDFENLEDSISDVCNMGYGAYEFLRTYELLLNNGIEKASYLKAGLDVCDFFIAHFSDKFGFGKAWRLNGDCVDTSGSIGAFLIPTFAKAFEITREEKYLDMAEKAMRFYMERDLDHFYCTAGALDTCCVDKETSSPFLMAAVLLYELTKKEIYLEYGEKAAYYFSSWMFHYQPCYRSEDDICKYDVTVRGLTAVSAQHHHLDVYATLLIPYLKKLAQYTKDSRWAIRADWMWNAAIQNIGDGKLTIHGRKRPIGSQNEAVFQCHWASEGFDRGALNDWLVAWPCAFRLSVLAEIL